MRASEAQAGEFSGDDGEFEEMKDGYAQLSVQPGRSEEEEEQAEDDEEDDIYCPDYFDDEDDDEDYVAEDGTEYSSPDESDVRA